MVVSLPLVEVQGLGGCGKMIVLRRVLSRVVNERTKVPWNSMMNRSG